MTLAHVKEFLQLLPLYTDSEEAQACHNLFFDQIIAKNPVLYMPEVEAEVKATVQRIVNIAISKPDLEILDDEGKNKAERIISG